MSESAFSAKEKFLDELEEQFRKNVKDFTSDVSSQILFHLPCLRNIVNNVNIEITVLNQAQLHNIIITVEKFLPGINESKCIKEINAVSSCI